MHRKGAYVAYLLTTAMIVCGGVTSVLAADDNAKFVFAPPPITDPVQPGESTNRGTFSYINIDVTDNPITLLGLNLTHRQGAKEEGGPGFSVAGGLLGGSDEDGTTGIFNFNIGANLEMGTPKAIPFVGLNTGMTVVNMDMPGMTVTTTMMSLGLLGGYQHHFELAPEIFLTPYATYGWQGYSGSAYSEYEYYIGGTKYTGSSTTDISGSTSTTTLGVDVSIHGVSLATLFSSGGDEDMTQFQVGFKF